jgi:hypothetical protein
MRHVSEILKELGFNEAAPESTKRAFLKHLERSANSEKSTFSSTKNHLPSSSAHEQLSFDFSNTMEVEEPNSEQK